jgi:hypothetical protein
MDDRELDATLAAAAQAEIGGPSGHLLARVLADFDRATARRKTSLLHVIGDWIWPGAALWQPASALVLALVIGILAGAFMPFDLPFGGDVQAAAATNDPSNDSANDPANDLNEDLP